MRTFGVICIVMFAVACGAKKQPTTTTTSTQNATMKADHEDADKDSKVDEAKKDKDGDHDEKTDEATKKD